MVAAELRADPRSAGIGPMTGESLDGAEAEGAGVDGADGVDSEGEGGEGMGSGVGAGAAGRGSAGWTAASSGARLQAATSSVAKAAASRAASSVGRRDRCSAQVRWVMGWLKRNGFAPVLRGVLAAVLARRIHPLAHLKTALRINPAPQSAYPAEICRFDATARCRYRPPCPCAPEPERARPCGWCVRSRPSLRARVWAHASSRGG